MDVPANEWVHMIVYIAPNWHGGKLVWFDFYIHKKASLAGQTLTQGGESITNQHESFDQFFTHSVLSLLARQVPSRGTRVYSTAETEPKDKRKLWLLIIPVTTFFLGTWQIFRLQWKLGLLDELEKKTMASPIDMPSK